PWRPARCRLDFLDSPAWELPEPLPTTYRELGAGAQGSPRSDRWCARQRYDGRAMTETGTDWRVVDGAATAWFDAPSLIEGAALAGRIVELSAEIVVDLRATGMRVRLDSDEHAEAVSAAARDLGLAANPAVLQHLSVVFESA